MSAQVFPQYITDFRQNLKADREKTIQEIKAYELLIEGNEILAKLAANRGPGQAVMYQIKVDGYEKSLAQSRRELARLDELLS